MEAKTESTPKAQPVAASADSGARLQKPEAAAAATSSSDFVFVEPAYDAKKTAADASGRSQPDARRKRRRSSPTRPLQNCCR